MVNSDPLIPFSYSKSCETDSNRVKIDATAVNFFEAEMTTEKIRSYSTELDGIFMDDMKFDVHTLRKYLCLTYVMQVNIFLDAYPK